MTATLVLSMAERLQRCATPITKFQLLTALTGKGQLTINNIPVTLRSIEREDGSGRSLNLLVYGPDTKLYRCYCRTVD